MGRVRAALVLLGDHLFRCVRQKLLGRELLVDAGHILLQPCDFLRQPVALLAEVDNVGQR